MISSGVVGLSRKSAVAMEFLRRWQAASAKGLFRGEWTNDTKSESTDPRCRGHRHDQSAASIIATQLGMQQENAGPMQYAAADTSVRDNIILKACGGPPWPIGETF